MDPLGGASPRSSVQGPVAAGRGHAGARRGVTLRLCSFCLSCFLIVCNFGC